jgi:hypothetical protein
MDWSVGIECGNLLTNGERHFLSATPQATFAVANENMMTDRF